MLKYGKHVEFSIQVLLSAGSVHAAHVITCLVKEPLRACVLTEQGPSAEECLTLGAAFLLSCCELADCPGKSLPHSFAAHHSCQQQT